MTTTAQHARADDRYVPLGMAGLAAIVLLILCAVLVARLTGFEPAQPQLAPLVDTRTLGFRDGAAGSVEIYDWDSGEEIVRIATGEGSFLRGVMRSLVRQRRGSAIPTGAPFLLSRYADNRLIISDPATGENIDLIAFGPTNIAVFAALMPASTATAGADYTLD